MSILERIISTKLDEVLLAKSGVSLTSLKERAGEQNAPLSLVAGIRNSCVPAIIAEVKFASPSKGIIRKDLNPVEVAVAYAKSGARAISVLTDVDYFGGSLEYLRQISEAKLGVPLLRKDFIIDPYQVWEARAAGADAILLIAAALSDEQLQMLSLEAIQARLEILLEIHNEDELARALNLFVKLREQKQDVPLPLLGINNRDLRSFVTDLAVTEKLAAILDDILKKEPYRGISADVVLVAESGISSAQDIKRLLQVGTRGFLIGESLLATGDPGLNLENLLNSFPEMSVTF